MVNLNLDAAVEVHAEPGSELERRMELDTAFWSSPAGEAAVEQLRLDRAMDEAAARDASPEWQAVEAAIHEQERLERMMGEAEQRDEYNAAQDRRRQAEADRRARATNNLADHMRRPIRSRPRERRARTTRRTSATASASPDGSEPEPPPAPVGAFTFTLPRPAGAFIGAVEVVA